MKWMMKTLLILVILAMPVSILSASDDAWIPNLNDALKIAKEENKPVFVDFSGSDWCGWCIKFDEHIATKEDFKTAMMKDFVLCIVDWRKKSPMPAEEEDHAKAMHKKYNITGFPSLLIIDTDGVPMKKINTSFKDGVDGVLAKVKAGLESGRKQKTICEETSSILLDENKTESEKIEAGIQLLENVEYVSFYQDAMDAVKSLASDDNKHGLQESFLLMDLKASPFPGRNMAQYNALIEKLQAIPNASTKTKQLTAVATAFSLKMEKKTEAALEAFAGAGDLNTYFGASLSDIEDWLKK